jgi:hypothetical protein
MQQLAEIASFFTDDLPLRDRFDAWLESISVVFDLRVYPAPPGGFGVSIGAFHIGEITWLCCPLAPHMRPKTLPTAGSTARGRHLHRNWPSVLHADGVDLSLVVGRD